MPFAALNERPKAKLSLRLSMSFKLRIYITYVPQSLHSYAGFMVKSAKLHVKEVTMANGTVKWFNGKKGFGFIQPEDGGADVFVHISALERAGLTDLREGQRVSYELAMNKGKTSAANLKVVDAA
jgi:CspA family cold shock protein